AAADYILPAVDGIGEVNHRFLEASGVAFHALSMTELARLVNYIITIICNPIARRGRGHRIRIGILSSNTSTNRSRRFPQRGSPVASVDTKEVRSWWAISRTGAGEWQPKGAPEQLRVHDFTTLRLIWEYPFG